jgi:hypothetical protein
VNSHVATESVAEAGLCHGSACKTQVSACTANARGRAIGRKVERELVPLAYGRHVERCVIVGGAAAGAISQASACG